MRSVRFKLPSAYLKKIRDISIEFKKNGVADNLKIYAKDEENQRTALELIECQIKKKPV